MKEDIIRKIFNGKDMIAEYRDSIHCGLQGILLNAIVDVFQEEVETLCGPKHYPLEGSEYKRAGSAPGQVYLEGREQKVNRPRVRSKEGNEVNLKSYENAKGSSRMIEDMFRAIAMGVSSRDVSQLHPCSKGFSKSQVSRKWVSNSVRYLEELRGRTVSDEPLVGMMIDGIVLSDSLTVLVSLGIYADGRKKMLDFEVGASENQELCHALIVRMKNRGVHFGGHPFFILDGSDALDRAVQKNYHNPIIQRCLFHKERNLKGYLPKKDYSELNRLMNKIRKAQGPESARLALGGLKKFLATKNKQAQNSLEEAGDSLIALHLLDVPSTLNLSLLSTNCIENAFKNFRRKTARVTRWKPETDMSERWTAYAMISIEQGFRKIKGCDDIPKLQKALGWRNREEEKAA